MTVEFNLVDSFNKLAFKYGDKRITVKLFTLEHQIKKITKKENQYLSYYIFDLLTKNNNAKLEEFLNSNKNAETLIAEIRRELDDEISQCLENEIEEIEPPLVRNLPPEKRNPSSSVEKSETVHQMSNVAGDIIFAARRTEDVVTKGAYADNYNELAYLSVFSRIVSVISLIILLSKKNINKSEIFDLSSYVILLALGISSLGVTIIGLPLIGAVLGVVISSVYVVKCIKGWAQYAKNYFNIKQNLKDVEIEQSSLDIIQNNLQHFIFLNEKIAIWEKIQEYILFKEIELTTTRLLTLKENQEETSPIASTCKLTKLIFFNLKITTDDLKKIGVTKIKDLKNIDVKNEIHNLTSDSLTCAHNLQNQLKSHNDKFATSLILNDKTNFSKLSHQVQKRQTHLSSQIYGLKKQLSQNYHPIEIVGKSLLTLAVLTATAASAVALTSLALGPIGLPLLGIASLVGLASAITFSVVGIFFLFRNHYKNKNQVIEKPQVEVIEDSKPQYNLSTKFINKKINSNVVGQSNKVVQQSLLLKEESQPILVKAAPIKFIQNSLYNPSLQTTKIIPADNLEFNLNKSATLLPC